MTTAQIGILIVMVVYLAGMMWIGVKVADRNKTAGDFYLGGRKLGPLVTAMSAEASDMSSYLLMGLPGLAYLSGLADVGWTAIGLAAGTYLNWLIVARKLRRYTEKLGAITVPEFFSKRYDDRKNLLTLAGALIIIVFFVPYTASGFAACGKLFSSLFGVNYYAAMVISAAVIIFYTSTGGFLAASLTDLIQSMIMTAALIIVLLFALNQAGGAAAAADGVRALPGYLSLTQSYDPVTGGAKPYSLLTIVSTLAWGLGYFGMPHILLRFMAIEDEKKLSVSRRVASVWALLAMGIAAAIGVAGLGMTRNGLIAPLSGAASETVIVEITGNLAQHGIFAAMVAGVVLSGILASTMSTSDSQLLAASSSVSNDILARFFHREMSEKKTLLISRITLLLISLIAIFLAWNPDSSVFSIVSFAWAGFGAAFGPVVLLALYGRRSNGAGALAGILAGGLMVFIWKFAVRPLGGIWNIYELLPAFLIALAVNVAVSLVTAAPGKEITETFDSVK
jgi:sodium/proline symporter